MYDFLAHDRVILTIQFQKLRWICLSEPCWSRFHRHHNQDEWCARKGFFANNFSPTGKLLFTTAGSKADLAKTSHHIHRRRPDRHQRESHRRRRNRKEITRLELAPATQTTNIAHLASLQEGKDFRGGGDHKSYPWTLNWLCWCSCSSSFADEVGLDGSHRLTLSQWWWWWRAGLQQLNHSWGAPERLLHVAGNWVLVTNWWTRLVQFEQERISG